MYQVLEESFVMDHIDPKKSNRDDWLELEEDEEVLVSQIFECEGRIRGKIPDGWITLYKISSNKRFARKLEESKPAGGAGRDEQDLLCEAECSDEEGVRPQGTEEAI